jgi:hypothetical protein
MTAFGKGAFRKEAVGKAAFGREEQSGDSFHPADNVSLPDEVHADEVLPADAVGRHFRKETWRPE